jgi:hypothetical protein
VRKTGHVRTLLTRSAVAIALLGAASGTACAPPEPQTAPGLPPAPIDADAPEGLSTATFAMG